MKPKELLSYIKGGLQGIKMSLEITLDAQEDKCAVCEATKSVVQNIIDNIESNEKKSKESR